MLDGQTQFVGLKSKDARVTSGRLSSLSDSSSSGERYCCRGYCIDLLVELAAKCNFTYSLHLSFEEYGILEKNNQSGKQVRQ